MCQFKYKILLKLTENETQKLRSGKILDLYILKVLTCQNFDIWCFRGLDGQLIILLEIVSQRGLKWVSGKF